MKSSEIFRQIYRCLTLKGTPEICCITEEQKMEDTRPIHLHDEFEVRMLLSADGSCLDRIDVTVPRVCHRSLAPEENERAHVLWVDDNAIFCQHRLSGLHQPFSSPYKSQLLQGFLSLAKDPDSAVYKEECRLLLALFYLRASSNEDRVKEIGDRIQNFAQYLERSYYMHDLSIGESAGRFGISPGYIQQVFRIKYSCNPKEYLLQVRMKNASKLLQERRYCIYEVASLCGFSDAHYFSGVFRRYYGESPRAYCSKSSQ